LAVELAFHFDHSFAAKVRKANNAAVARKVWRASGPFTCPLSELSSAASASIRITHSRLNLGAMEEFISQLAFYANVMQRHVPATSACMIRHARTHMGDGWLIKDEFVGGAGHQRPVCDVRDISVPP
jgi:hypothetical protein